MYKLWSEGNKTERLYIDANKLVNERRDVMKKKRLTEAELQEIKNEVKTIIKKIKKNLYYWATWKWIRNEEIFLGFDTEREPVMLK